MADDDDDHSRPTSHSSSGRRRWEMHSKESFETTLAVETPSPAPRNIRNVLSAKNSSSELPLAAYGNKMVGAADNKSRVKSAARKNSALSRETSAEIRHAQKMAEGRRARGASANNDAKIFKENKSTKPGKVPAPTTRSSSRNSKHLSSEDVSSSDMARPDELLTKPPKHDNILADALAAKHFSILSAANMTKRSRPSSQETAYTEDSVSREEGYETDDHKFRRVKHVTSHEKEEGKTHETYTQASAPPLEKIPNNKHSNTSRKNSSRDIFSKTPTKSSSSSPSSSETKKKRRKSRKRDSVRPVPDSYISEQLQKLRDDIVDSSSEIRHQVCDNGQFGAENPSLLPLPSLVLPNTRAEKDLGDNQKFESTVRAIYCEKVRGFALAKDWQRYAAEAGLTVESGHCERLHPNWPSSRASLAARLQTSFRTFSVFSQGLLAGVSLAHCVLVFLIAESWQDVTSALLPRLTHVFYSLIVFLTLICFVASCDRGDLCSGSGSLIKQHGVHVPWSAALYLTSLSVTLATTRASALLVHRHAPLPDVHQAGGVGWYGWMCLARTIANILAWLAVVPDPHSDALAAKLNHCIGGRDAPDRHS
ncbi:uncharacterized protein LOC108678091 [Hyalella azteca]|uniref:Uncharacterized protein LOC108678091 n=1 Tax=Hyalella azteca TaxID=294128 RepID=A0A8B7P7X2_HYAAZ|nr:uncharacterized protein LOC108678091 [Hyalella azteca]XP_018021924.1 uncharacterized protein LOC108678091 [Hyalella azteca]